MLKRHPLVKLPFLSLRSPLHPAAFLPTSHHRSYSTPFEITYPLPLPVYVSPWPPLRPIDHGALQAVVAVALPTKTSPPLGLVKGGGQEGKYAPIYKLRRGEGEYGLWEMGASGIP